MGSVLLPINPGIIDMRWAEKNCSSYKTGDISCRLRMSGSSLIVNPIWKILNQCAPCVLKPLARQILLGLRFAYTRFYPGKPAEILRLVHEKKIIGTLQGLEHTVFVRFNL